MCTQYSLFMVTYARVSTYLSHQYVIFLTYEEHIVCVCVRVHACKTKFQMHGYVLCVCLGVDYIMCTFARWHAQ
jgi:hypothetical protein